MARNHNIFAFFLTFVVVFATTITPSAHARICNRLTRVLTTGRLCCTPTGNCDQAGAQPLSGTSVRVNCTDRRGVSTVIGQNTTDVDGSFTINAPTSPRLIRRSDLFIPCVAVAEPPVNGTACPALANTTTLSSPIIKSGNLVRSSLGSVQPAIAIRFSTQA